MEGRDTIKNGKKSKIHLHREVLKLTEDYNQNNSIDHIDRDPLNNQKSNLRVCTNSQNQANKQPQANNKCGYKGVWKIKKTERWRCAVSKDGKRYYCRGSFKTAEEAAIEYNRMAIKYHGEFAWLNDINNPIEYKEKAQPCCQDCGIYISDRAKRCLRCYGISRRKNHSK